MHLHLVKNEANLMPNMVKYKASRTQLKHFLELTAKSREAMFDQEQGLDEAVDMLHELHSQGLIFLFHYWTKIQAESSKLPHT